MWSSFLVLGHIGPVWGKEAGCPRSGTARNRLSASCGRRRWNSAEASGFLSLQKLGVSEQTYYRWRKEYGGLRLDQAKRLRALEQENLRLKKLVADQALDNALLKEVASGNF